MEHIWEWDTTKNCGDRAWNVCSAVSKSNHKLRKIIIKFSGNKNLATKCGKIVSSKKKMKI